MSEVIRNRRSEACGWNLTPFRQRFGGHLSLYVESDEMVPLAGIEPARCRQQQILSLPRLPVPPQGHSSQACGLAASR